MNDRKAKILTLRTVRRWQRKSRRIVAYCPYIPFYQTPLPLPDQRTEFLIGYKGSTFYEGPFIFVVP